MMPIKYLNINIYLKELCLVTSLIYVATHEVEHVTISFLRNNKFLIIAFCSRIVTEVLRSYP